MDRVAPRPSPELRCAFCHGPAVGVDACPGCGTLMHLGCRAEAGIGCITIGCRGATAARSGVGGVTTRTSSRLGVRVLTGVVLAGFCLISALAFRPEESESFGNWWAWALVLFVLFVLGFLCSLLFVAAAVVSEALCFVLNGYQPDRDRRSA